MPSCRSLAMAVFLLAALVASGCGEPRAVQVSLGVGQWAGLYWEPEKRLSPALLLLPPEGGKKEDWGPLAARLRRDGYGVLALDSRAPSDAQSDERLAEVRAGFDFLREQQKVDAARIGLVGAEGGANAALDFTAREPLARLAVLLSPGAEARVAGVAALRDYGVRPLLLLAAEEDEAASDAVRLLADAAQGEAVVKLYPGPARGAGLLDETPALTEEILAFLRGRL